MSAFNIEEIVDHDKLRDKETAEHDEGVIGQPSQLLDEESEEDLVLGLAPNQHALEALFDHFIKEVNGNPIPFGRGSKAGLFLEILGGTGGIYAWPPAMEFAKNYAPWIKYSFSVSNPISNALFLIKATDDLLGKIELESSPPAQLTQFIDVMSTKDLVIKYSKMTLGALICVVPFSIQAYLFPIPGCHSSACLGVTVAHSTISNAILHGVAWGIILTPQYWYYRLPFLPFEKLYAFIKNCTKSQNEKLLSEMLTEQQGIQAKYASILVKTMGMAAQNIIRGRSSTRSPRTAIQQTDCSLTQFVMHAQQTGAPSPQETMQQLTWLYKLLNFIANNFIPFMGALIMLTGCIGWIADPVYLGFHEGWSATASIAVGALPVYSTGVLCAFYGAGIASQLYQYFTTWNGPLQDKVATEIQMYPKTFALYTLANIYVSFFAFATAAELIQTVFADEMWDEARPVLEYISIPTLQLLSFVPLSELFSLVIRKMQAKFGHVQSDDTLAARLMLKMEAIAHYLYQMKGSELMLSLSRYSRNQQNTMSIDSDAFEQDYERFFELQRQADGIRAEISVEQSGRSCSPLLRNSLFGRRRSVSTPSESTALLQLTSLNDQQVVRRYG